METWGFGNRDFICNCAYQSWRTGSARMHTDVSVNESVRRSKPILRHWQLVL